QVSWLTSLLHADILSSRFHQQANSPGSWTKLALKPLLLKRIQNASLETCVSWQTSLLHADILTNSPGSWAKLALNHPLLHKRIQNASWESCGCGAGVLSLGILGSTGCRSSTQGPAAKSQVFKLRWLQRPGCERCHLGQQRRSEGDVDFMFHGPGSWATLALNHPLLDKRIQNASWETCVLVLKGATASGSQDAQ
ncbi:Holin-like protein CidA, partial [Frankliniella fusca]